MADMLAVRIHDFGGPEVLRVDTIPRPEPKAEEVLVRVHAASVNPVDFKTRSGSFPVVTRDKLPITLGRDISGIVELAGSGVRSFTQGQAVFALLDPEHGGYAEYVAIKAGLCAAKPRTLDHAEAAAVPLAALTAWQGLFDQGQLQAGQQVLIHGGAGGVGHMAVQFAKARGARVIATVGSGDIDFVRELGADQAIDYKAQRFEELVRDVDVVFDLIGGDTQTRSWSVLKRGGVLVSTLGKPPDEAARKHQARGAGFLAEPNAGQLSEVAQLIDAGKVRVVVQGRYRLRDAVQAQRKLEHEHVRGKLVLEVSGA
jgi:NADPH:quinone reductase-like Zn-dependent oxidoreductase